MAGAQGFAEAAVHRSPFNSEHGSLPNRHRVLSLRDEDWTNLETAVA